MFKRLMLDKKIIFRTFNQKLETLNLKLKK